MENDIYQQQKYFKRCPHSQSSTAYRLPYKYGVVVAAVYKQIQTWCQTSTLDYEGHKWVNPKELDWVTEVDYIPLEEVQRGLLQSIALGIVIKESLIVGEDNPDTFYTTNRDAIDV